LSLDISTAYPNVNRAKLIAILRKKAVSEWLVKFVPSFFCDQQTTLSIPGHHNKSTLQPVNNGIPQGSALSPILFLFFASPLLEALEKGRYAYEGETMYGVAYVDDTYLIAISRHLKINCTLLEKAHKRCIEWATAAGVTFSPEKYHVIHFTRSCKSGARTLLPKIDGFTSEAPETPFLILGVVLDCRLTFRRILKV
jgi:hypothetical protein